MAKDCCWGRLSLAFLVSVSFHILSLLLFSSQWVIQAGRFSKLLGHLKRIRSYHSSIVIKVGCCFTSFLCGIFCIITKFIHFFPFYQKFISLLIFFVCLVSLNWKTVSRQILVSGFIILLKLSYKKKQWVLQSQMDSR